MGETDKLKEFCFEIAMVTADETRVSRGKAFCVKVGERLLTQPDYVVFVDRLTGLLRRTPCLSDEDLAYYYRHNDWRIHRSHCLFPTEVYLRQEMIKRLPMDAKILDIGCGDGRLLASLPESWKKYGTELSEEAAREATIHKGVQIIKHQQMLEGSEGQFDAIVMVDVFEHLKDSYHFLNSLLSVLKPGGLLGIATGNGDYPAVKEDAANFWYFRVVAHVCMWTETFAQLVEQKLRLERVAVHQCSHYHFQARKWLKQRLQKVIFDLFYLKKYDRLRILAAYIPGVRRGLRWTQRPPYWFGRDHIVNIFRKLD